MKTPSRHTALARRSFLQLGAAGIAAAALPLQAAADAADADAAIREIFGDKPLNEGRVSVKLPPIAENGNSVAITVAAESLMSPDDYVRRIAIFSPRNPIAEVALFKLGPRAGKAEISTRIRMAGTQRIRAVAEMSDGTLWHGSASTVVTLAACLIG
ncbi:thiosulfate oxidation carrier protein SoxY [Henriciella algicola]|uniref:Sulfur oxidation protein SoxY n=1 Tax=Henriciella algicola TaxID=1608422 RepID=A0A399RN99_9PROT|nr:thiosulfate oxidation carrier protein SoxY [Henriciella algicola]RIJ31379.1 sulfur oxidation protein SoxY [Henriciella algicola]